MRRRYRWWDAGILGAIVALILLLRFFGVPADGGTVTVGGVDLPGMCVYHRLTGEPCPGCGMSRAVVLMAHGRFVRAQAMTPAAWPFAIFVGLQALWRLGHLLAGAPRARYWGWDIGISVGTFYLVLVIPWLGRLLGLV